ncbi:MAG TPA: hypothetical protein VHE60_10460 [Pyrinomonadaceae bacterium]|nr:hypothetical protein [Pyrinomonadaceae bacterium]
MCLSLRPALAVVVLLIVFPFARSQDKKAGSQVSGSIAQPIGGSPVRSNKDKPDWGEKKKAPDEASAADRISGANPSLGDPLVRVLVTKGILTAEEGSSISSSGTPFEQRNRLAALLRDKGLISATEFEAVRTVAPSENRTAATVATAEKSIAAKSTARAAAQQKPSPPPMNAAFAPVRLLPIDPPKREGLIPDIKLGSGARLKLYGFFKTSVIHDSSSPQGNDFPLPLLAGDTGPDTSPEFHVRARGLRIGANFEWLDPAPKTVITGKLELDFEGNFGRVNNRNASSIRSSSPSIRLAWARIDRRLTEKTSGFALFGQDWTPFASSTLPPLIENTNFGGPGYGAAYQRAPQARFGLRFNAGGARSWKFAPEFALVVPAFGNLPANVADQLGFAERQGADSQRPAIEGRFVTEFQLDRAAGVAPAQFIVSFEHARRRAIVTAANVPAAFRAAFPGGVDVDSNSDGFTAEIQLPTRFVTIMSKYYGGSDLRFFAAGQLLSNFNDTAGLTSTATASSIDGASTVVFGLRNGVPTVAPQRPVRATGGFISFGFPLSRIFDADPKGRNAGWSAVLYYGFDEAKARDARRFSPVRGKSDLFLGNISYKLNSLITFAYEQGLYRTRAANNSIFDFGGLPLLRGIPSRAAHNVRSEFATIFSF